MATDVLPSDLRPGDVIDWAPEPGERREATVQAEAEPIAVTDDDVALAWRVATDYGEVEFDLGDFVPLVRRGES
jgi:hypothetical protein